MPKHHFSMHALKQPETQQEWSAYYELRWLLLRAPWQQPPGSERDELDASAIHRCIVDKHSTMLAIGRLHINHQHSGQIRYMAVANRYRRQGLGTQILLALESAATEHRCTNIQLNARETALAFYQYHGYTVTEKAHCLFGKIQHYLMHKNLHLGAH